VLKTTLPQELNLHK